MFSDIQAFANLQHTEELYYYRPWMQGQNKGYISYTRIAFQDHSYQYDSSDYKDPASHKMQKAPDGAYAFRKDYLCTLNSKGMKKCPSQFTKN